MSVAVGKAPDWKQWEGESAGEFPLEQFLGAGKKSAVFRTQLAGDRAAIKLIPAADSQADELIAQWDRARALDNPHFLKIHNTGKWENGGLSLAYVVTEYADENLGAVLLDRPLTGDEVLEMLTPVAAALEYLHGQGLAHGQLRPANIFAIDDTLKLSSDSVYPVQASGEVARDMSALAATVVEALTRWPVTFTAGDGELAIVGKLERTFQEIVRNCSGQSGRPQWSAAELADWLRSPRVAMPAFSGPMMLVPASGSRRPKPTNYVLGGVLSLVAVGTVGAYMRYRSAEPPAVIPPVVKTTEQVPAPPPPAPKQQTGRKQPVKTELKSEPVNTEAAKGGLIKSESGQPRSAPAVASGGQEQVVHQVLPEITDKARQTVHGTVVLVINVTVDPSGEVTDASLRPTGSKYLGKLALEAARKWRFAPGGPQERSLRFEITRTDTKVFPQK
jgi:TonB family protein